MININNLTEGTRLRMLGSLTPSEIYTFYGYDEQWKNIIDRFHPTLDKFVLQVKENCLTVWLVNQVQMSQWDFEENCHTVQPEVVSINGNENSEYMVTHSKNHLQCAMEFLSHVAKIFTAQLTEVDIQHSNLFDINSLLEFDLVQNSQSVNILSLNDRNQERIERMVWNSLKFSKSFVLKFIDRCSICKDENTVQFNYHFFHHEYFFNHNVTHIQILNSLVDVPVSDLNLLLKEWQNGANLEYLLVQTPSFCKKELPLLLQGLVLSREQGPVLDDNNEQILYFEKSSITRENGESAVITASPEKIEVYVEKTVEISGLPEEAEPPIKKTNIRAQSENMHTNGYVVLD